LWDRFYRYYTQARIALDEPKEKGSMIPHILLRDINGKFESQLENSPSDEMMIEISGLQTKRTVTSNVIGMVEGIDHELKDEFIVCTAHYDHVGIGRPDASGDSIYNGARDNAVGVMNVMMAAENIAKYPVKRSVLFILFAGEEKGLLGSRSFVNHPPVSLSDIVFCLNTDGGGYNDTTIATVIGKRRIETYQIFERACHLQGLSAFDGTDNTQFLFNLSDNINFSREGIPSVTFSLGFREMDAEIIKHYHQPSDEAESLDFNYIFNHSTSFGLSLRMIADSDKQLFWKNGDEFYQKGIELYQH
jgi:Zn-dependent M28 family amino/carboxypeptidase